MLDVRVLAYVSPLAEQVLDDITPSVLVQNFANEDAIITGTIRIYRRSTDQRVYTSELATTTLNHGTYATIPALTAWSPGAPADDDYYVLADILATSFLPGPPIRSTLGAWTFDIKPGPMGPAPAAHASTHELGGMDELDVSGLTGLLHDLADPDAHTSSLPPGQLIQADANGLPVDATNTDAEVADVVSASTPQTLTDQAAIDWDLAAGGAAEVTLGGNRTLNAPSNMVAGQRYRLKVIQDGTGTRLITWNAIYRFPGGVHPCLTAAVNCIDLLIFDCDGTYMDCVSMVNAVS